MRNIRSALVLTVMASLGLALAQQSPLKLVLSQFLVQTVTEGGKSAEHLVAAPKEALPGTVLEQDLAASNTGKTGLRNVQLKLPVPAGTVFVSQSGASAEATTEFSFDGGKRYGVAPLKRSVTVTENGQSVTREVVVPATEYTNVRWTLPTLAAGHVAKFSLRVKVK